MKSRDEIIAGVIHRKNQLEEIIRLIEEQKLQDTCSSVYDDCKIRLDEMESLLQFSEN